METWIKQACSKAEQVAQQEEPWEAYYRIRATEFDILLNLIEQQLVKLKNYNKKMTVLEIGAGNGFQSYLWSHIADKVIATDVQESNIETHSLGRSVLESFFKKMKTENIQLILASADKIPLKDEAVDVIYSSYVLHYIPLDERKKVIHEMMRVLKPSGLMIHIVPNFMERITNVLWCYPYFVKQAGIKLLRRLGVHLKGETEKILKTTDGKNKKKSFLEKYPHFPFPEPHGNYKSSTEECLSHLPSRWQKQFKDESLILVTLGTTMYIPFNPLDVLIGKKYAAVLYAITAEITKQIGTLPLLNRLGTSYFVVYKKKS